jgi:hypothetical protein
MDKTSKMFLTSRMSLNDSDIPMLSLDLRVKTAFVREIGYAVLLFCKEDDDCLKADETFDIVSGQVHIDLTGYSLGSPDPLPRALQTSAAYSRFLTQTPRFVALGVSTIGATNFVSLRLVIASMKKITVEYSAKAGSDYQDANFIYLVSNWGNTSFL